MKLEQKIKLPCGAELSNRLGKSAMSENMAMPDHTAGKSYYNLYRQWALGGLGLCISGNVMVDKNYLGEPDNVVIEDDKSLLSLKKWASSTHGTSMSLWVQLNHPGKQTPKFLTKRPVAPSAIPLDPKMQALFATPRELKENEIWDIIKRFGVAAKIVKDAGFQGVQIHGAHGYLVSQFLSSKHNQRKDQWGGDLENRMRFLVEIYKSIRQAVGPSFPIGVKINSADFQKGGFTHEEAIFVCKTISDLGIDLIEISGGSYEKPVMMLGERESTKKREAYFLQYAKDIKKVIKCPLMVTGGFRTHGAMEEALISGDVDIVGLARSLAIDPEFPNKLMRDKNTESPVRPISTGLKFIDSIFPLEIIWYTLQLHRMGQNKKPLPNLNPWSAIYFNIKNISLNSLRRVRAK